MKLDYLPFEVDLKSVASIARRAEGLGLDALFLGESTCEADYPLLLAAEHTTRLGLGTAITGAFIRSPMVTAYKAWNLQQYSGGRYMLGLGAQVKAQLERRFSVSADSPGPRIREVVLALRSIWQSWQTGGKLDFRGRFYSFTLSLPAFTPKPIDHPGIPVLLAAVNPYMCRIAGEVADGVHLHAFTSMRYLREVSLPNIDIGLQKSGRSRADIKLVAPIFTITGRTDGEMAASREEVRRNVAFYASTPSYKLVLETHGWGERGDRIRAALASGKADDLVKAVDDEMLATFAIEAPADRLAETVRARYEGLADRVCFLPPRPLEDEDFWRKAAGIMHE